MGDQEVWCRAYSSEGEPIPQLIAHYRSRVDERNQFEPGKPEQYCSPIEGIGSGTPIYVSSYPVAWRVERMDEGVHNGFEYVRSESDFIRYTRKADIVR